MALHRKGAALQRKHHPARLLLGQTYFMRLEARRLWGTTGPVAGCQRTLTRPACLGWNICLGYCVNLSLWLACGNLGERRRSAAAAVSQLCCSPLGLAHALLERLWLLAGLGVGCGYFPSVSSLGKVVSSVVSGSRAKGWWHGRIDARKLCCVLHQHAAEPSVAHRDLPSAVAPNA
jgi:hypothetical protein